jgi:hypothetical protein
MGLEYIGIGRPLTMSKAARSVLTKTVIMIMVSFQPVAYSGFSAVVWSACSVASSGLFCVPSDVTFSSFMAESSGRPNVSSVAIVLRLVSE